MEWWQWALLVYVTVWFFVAVGGLQPDNSAETAKTAWAASFIWPLWALRFAWWFVLWLWGLACWFVLWLWGLACWTCQRAWADWKAAGK